jgi:hypothetical protein
MCASIRIPPTIFVTYEQSEMAQYSRAGAGSIVGPQGSRPPHQSAANNGFYGGAQPQAQTAASNASQNIAWVLYVDPRDDLCQRVIAMCSHIDPSFVWIQDVTVIAREQRPSWLTGVPSLVSRRDQLVYRGTQALQQLGQLVQQVGGGSGGGASNVTSLQDVMMVDAPPPSNAAQQHHRPQQQQHPQPQQRQQPEAAAALGAGAGAAASGFSEVQDALNGTFAATGSDPRYDESNSRVTGAQLDSYASRRKNYAAQVPTL